jgi:thiamine biosynthesis lipoprotein
VFLVMALVGSGLFSNAQVQSSKEALNRFEFERPEMGVPFRIVLYAPDAQKAEAAAQAAFHRVADLNQIMSDYETDSELNELSRTSGKGQSVHVSDDLWTVLEQAQHFAELSDGAFDITVGPVVSLWRKARRTHELPDANRLAEALKAVGYKKVRLNPKDHTVELLVSGMKLDLGGIAKGYALDQEIKVLNARGIERALVSGGGDMSLSDAPPGQSGWRIEIAPLDVPNAPPKRFARLAQMGLATSGDLFQHLEINGKRYSHVVDPHTGIGLTDHSLVTIIAPNCMTADAVAKIVGVLGPERGLKILAQSIPSVEAHVVRKPDDQIELKESPGFGRFCEKP